MEICQAVKGTKLKVRLRCAIAGLFAPAFPSISSLSSNGPKVIKMCLSMIES